MEKSSHEVFISFRGEDTRYSFTSHLHAALKRLKIKTYIDYDLQSGDEISSALIKAIEGSKISVVVFSKHYAHSKWCLDELVKIIECKNSDGQTVVPIFYDVNPSTLRRQTETYEEAFSKHEQRLKDNPQKVQKWRAALAEAADISGWDCSVNRMESDLVEKIANDVLKKLLGVGGDDDLEGEIAMCKRMAQRHEEAYLRTRDVSHWNAYNATHQRIAQLQQQLMVRLRDQSLGHTT